ncbi:DUF6431 domain-containing protein [Thomasclavelia sp.]|uniref:DUF6431 domain-containing protein n=1 Tax=Thomasclavelia sp. TaxID=3025757 RepID=UPI0025EEE926|nr:DUF6431 domain-containing protein [Thomasclavelia sp.]
MITITDRENYSNKRLTQETYDSIIKLINFKEIKCTCGKTGDLVKIGSYPRHYKIPERKICIQVQRVMCKNCGRTHAVLIHCMVPASMLLVATQIEILQSYYNHSLLEFLDTHSTIDLSNIYYVVRNYEKRWKTYLETANLSLDSNINSLINYFIDNYNIQFMQMKRNINIIKY